mmetsp:Transcript_104108/g.144959  ORF Transcript_104108/g.144959 Transcript_104108/m.144959 type:complete len:219 (+) Transcript_104108:152-808(+)
MSAKSPSMPQSSFSILSMSDSGTSPMTMILPMSLKSNRAACRRKGYPNSEDISMTLACFVCFVHFVMACRADLAAAFASSPSPGNAKFASSTRRTGILPLLLVLLTKFSIFICFAWTTTSSTPFAASPAPLNVSPAKMLPVGASTARKSSIARVAHFRDFCRCRSSAVIKGLPSISASRISTEMMSMFLSLSLHLLSASSLRNDFPTFLDPKTKVSNP